MESSEVLGRGKYLQLISKNGWEYTERCLGSGVVAIIAGHLGKIILVEQERPSLRKRVVELPAGLVGDQDHLNQEKLAEAAHRELLEETGYQAKKMNWLFDGPPSSGLSNEIISFYLAEEIEKVSAGGGDASESILVHEVPLVDLENWVAQKQSQGLLVDPKVFVGAYYLRKSP
jgi:ADP-ribose pyrophosphatase